jgi:hypothetical protein
MMTDEERIQRARYRFSGYTIPLIKLDEGDPAYLLAPPQPPEEQAPELWKIQETDRSRK